ncbi:histidine kinase [Umezawaea sp. Da 62-37]|uniref:sensor histidine kinase n=1 Tax=Umezawaea sp. Da 62-37 TaxID=3075927 RepID=UPI0028F6F490|nr:histidine kinase [Umezawaea sp. Da 62-37]WNV88081.1 histidine kinase [Umezawaea sp. Da 62-37]
MTSSAVGVGRTLAHRVFGREVEQSLARQSILVAVVCLVTDAVSFATRGPESIGVLDGLLLLGLVAADAALASSPRYSGWVALGHALLVPVLAIVLPGRSATTTGFLVSAYRAGAWLRGGPAALSLAVLALGVLSSLLVDGSTAPFALLTLVTANTVLPWLVGRYTTARKAHVDELRRQREDALRDAEAEVGKAVAKERETIANDLHDVISHHVSAIGVHAAAARLNLVDRHSARPGPVDTSLAAVEASSRAAMVDLRRLLDLLHQGDDSAGQPGLGKLQELFDGVRSSGLRVAFAVYNDPCPITRTVDTALYRVAQEMMTNALRHGDGTAVRVELEYGGDHVSITARNRIASGSVLAGRDSLIAQRGSSRGLRGMGQRAEMAGGSATSGPVEDGQFWETTVTMPTGTGS